MKPITNLEKAVGGVRATEEYQRILALAEEMERVGDYSRKKVEEIAHYCLPNMQEAKNWKFDKRDFEFLFNKILKKPYVVMGYRGDEKANLASFETFEEAFDYAELRWEEIKESEEKLFDCLKIVSVVNRMRAYFFYENSGEEEMIEEEDIDDC